MVAVGIGLGLLVGIVRWLLENWWVLVVAAVVAVAVGAVWCWRRSLQQQREADRLRGLRLQMSRIDGLRHDEFEFAVRDLMARDGARAERKGGSGDNGCDVMATDPFGRRWVIQCKHRRAGLSGSAVGTPDLQTLNGTARPVHRAHVVVLVTNGRFTRTAFPWGRQQRIHLVDRNLLAQWAAGAQPLWELLDRLPPPRQASELS